MSQRSDALATMRGQRPSRIPFIGRMNLWYNYHNAHGSLPERYTGWSLWDIQRDLDIGILGFGAWTTTFFKKVVRGVEVRKTGDESDEITEYVTPYGTLRSRYVFSDLLKGTVDGGAFAEFLFKDERDYDALRYLIEHTDVVENYDEYGKFIESIGEDGLALPYTGWVPMHEIMWRYMGAEKFYYELQDHPGQLERLHEAFLNHQRQIIALAARCPAAVVQVGGNYDEYLTPHTIFDLYFAPFYRESLEVLHKAGKITVAHGDGDMDRLLKCLMDVGVQVVEAFTPEPSTSINVRKTRALWDGRVTMWGGVPYGILDPDISDSEFEDYVRDLYRAVAPGDRFVLGFGDNVPPETPFHRLKWLAEFHQKYGAYPIRV